MKWTGIDTDTSPIDDTPGKAVYQQNTRMRVDGELRRRRGMARSSLAKFTSAATGQSSTNNNVGPFSMFQVGSTLEGLSSGYALWGDAQLIQPSGYATLSGSVYTININRQGDTTAQAYVIIAKAGNFPVSPEDGFFVESISATAGDNSLSTTWTRTSAGNWFFAAYGKADGQISPLGRIEVVGVPVTNVSTLSNPPGSTIYFGNVIAVSDDAILIADWGSSLGAANAGTVYVYDHSFNLLETLPSLTASMVFGIDAVWCDGGERAVIGAYGYSGFAGTAGALAVYSWDGTNLSLLEEIFSDATASSQRNLGFSVAAIGDGSLIYSGAPNSFASTGRVYIYNGSPTSHGQGVIFLPSRSTVGDRFGESMSASKDGRRLAVGAPYGLSAAGNAGGICMLYDIGPGGTLINEFIAEPRGSDDGTSSQFGKHMSFSPDGTRFVVSSASYVYYYERRGSAWENVNRIAVGGSPHTPVRFSQDGAYFLVGVSSHTYWYETVSQTQVADIAATGISRVDSFGESRTISAAFTPAVKYTT